MKRRLLSTILFSFFICEQTTLHLNIMMGFRALGAICDWCMTKKTDTWLFSSARDDKWKQELESHPWVWLIPQN